jgi:GNAT superfamily N-acetyltransferase
MERLARLVLVVRVIVCACVCVHTCVAARATDGGGSGGAPTAAAAARTSFATTHNHYIKKPLQKRWIQSVYVPPQHRKHGHFKRLYAAVRELAAKERVGGLRLYAEKANTRAHAVVSLVKNGGRNAGRTAVALNEGCARRTQGRRRPLCVCRRLRVRARWLRADTPPPPAFAHKHPSLLARSTSAWA